MWIVVCALTITAGPAHAGLVEEPGSPIAVGTEPWWATTADFNGDGRTDIAVANDDSASPSGTVSVLLRQPFGGFVAEDPITVGARPDSLTSADFDGDGRRDLAVANYVSSTVTVLLRKADNTGFAAEGAPLAVGTSPHSVAAGDLDGDGRTDLVTASHALGTVTVLLRKTDNTGFAEDADSPVAVGTNPTQLALADFNGDDRLDIASANRGSDDITVLLRTAGNDAFVAEPGTPPAAGDAPVGLVSTDFDGDGRPDLAVAAESSDDVTVLLRQAGGGFAAAPGSPHPAGDGAYGVATGDFNADGIPDLAATAFTGNRVTLLHGTGTGDFAQPSFSPLPTAKGPLVLAAADFDANGRSDLAIPNHDANTLTVRMNQADPDPAPVPVAPPGCLPPSAGRVALWRGEDNARDSIGGHDGTLENGAGYRDGRVGRAFSLAGSDDYVHVPDRPELNITGDVTLDAWVQIDDLNFENAGPNGVGGDRVFFFKGDAPADGNMTFLFWIDGEFPAAAAPLGFMAGDRSQPGAFVRSEPVAWSKDTWYHVAVTRSGDTVTFYRDGQPIGSATIGQPGVTTPGAAVALSTFPEAGTIYNPLDGGLDEAEIWSRALTAAEVGAIHDTVTGACREPDTTITSKPPALTNDPTPTFEFGSDVPGATFECSLDNAGYAGCTSPHTTAVLADGPHTFRVRAIVDPAGRRRSAVQRAADPDPPAIEFVVDTTPPDTAISAGPAEGATLTAGPTFSFTSSEADSTFTCRIGAQTFGCASPRALDPGAGTWTFAVAATDPAGNVDPTPAERTFVVAPPRPVNTVRPRIVNALSCPTTAGGGGCTTDPNMYRCDPGTWAGRDEGLYYGFAWYRMVKDGGSAEGYRRQDDVPEAYGEYFRAASETSLGMDPVRWVYQCAVEAYNITGTTTAYSPPRQLTPERDPFGSEFVYGDFSVRGIDVFQVVQPNAGARAFGWDPARDQNDDPVRDAGGADLAFGFDMAGGGTPTNYRRTAFGGGELRPGTDPQRVAYSGVTLDADKPAVAVVYVSRKTLASAGQTNFPLQLTLRARVDGRLYDSPLTRELSLLDIARTPYVTATERTTTDGAQFRLPASWLLAAQSSRLDLEATLAFVPQMELVRPTQCDGTAACTADDHFRLDGVPARPLPWLDIMGVRLAEFDGEPGLDLEAGDLTWTRELFPGGQRFRAFTVAGNVVIGDILSRREYQPGQPKCEGTEKDTNPQRSCWQNNIGARLKEWESTNARLRPLYDMVLGVHDYTIPGNTPADPSGPEPGWAIGPRLGRPFPRPPMGFINNGSANRPLTAVAHEIGHLLDLPHAGRQCPLPVGYKYNETGFKVDAATGTITPNGQLGEFWPTEDRGRVQGTTFRSMLAPGRNLESDPIPPHVDRGPDPALPAAKDAGKPSEDPDVRIDLMSYCAYENFTSGTSSTNAWLSARNWNHTFGILEAFGTAQAARATSARPDAARAASTSPGTTRAAASGSALAIGIAGPAGGTITRVVPPRDGLSAPPPDPTSPVRIRALDAAGKLLAEVGARVERSSESGSAAGTFAVAIPGATAAVELVTGGRVLARKDRSKPPAVTLRSPGRGVRVARGKLLVQWTASDPDGDALQASVGYSTDDGRTFRTVAQLPAQTGRARLAGGQLEGSRRARIRVVVDDGFGETSVVSPRLVVDGTPPAVEIIAPASGERLRAGGRTALLGRARDDAMRPVSRRALTWYAGQRRLGTGERLSVRLPAGRYALRLVARDRAGRTSTARRLVRVDAPALTLTRVAYDRQVAAGARSLTVTIATSIPATVTAAGRAYAVGPRAKRLRIALPARPAHGRVGVPVSIRGGGQRRSGRLVVVRR